MGSCSSVLSLPCCPQKDQDVLSCSWLGAPEARRALLQLCWGHQPSQGSGRVAFVCTILLPSLSLSCRLSRLFLFTISLLFSILQAEWMGLCLVLLMEPSSSTYLSPSWMQELNAPSVGLLVMPGHVLAPSELPGLAHVGDHSPHRDTPVA